MLFITVHLEHRSMATFHTKNGERNKKRKERRKNAKKLDQFDTWYWKYNMINFGFFYSCSKIFLYNIFKINIFVSENHITTSHMWKHLLDSKILKYKDENNLKRLCKLKWNSIITGNDNIFNLKWKIHHLINLINEVSIYMNLKNKNVTEI
jgi:hypothetical protein